jgi:hypothetical protein
MEALINKSSPLASTIRWVARILCLLAIVFIGMWSIEAVEGKVGLGRQILGFLMAPPFLLSVVLIIILIIAWKRELVGGILFALIRLATAPFIYSYNYHRTLNMASRGWTGSPGLQALKIVAMFDLSFIIVGVLFIISCLLHRPKKLATSSKVK